MDPQARPLAALALLCLLSTSAPMAGAAGLPEEAPRSAARSNPFTAAPAVQPGRSVDAAPMRLPSHPPGLAGGLLMRPASPVAGHGGVAGPAPERKSADPVVAGFLGLLPLGSGFYVTSTPWKGLAFTLADAVLLGSIYNIRRDDRLPDGDVVPYFVLLAGVNAVDAALSAWQAHNDRAARVHLSLTPSGDPKMALAWTF
jgi:hypothetical protein